MNTEILAAIVQALRADTPARFLQSERGYQGRFYCSLQGTLDERGILKDGVILEMEYQKSARHLMTQRPDIILHVPTEESGAEVKDNNFAVIAIKRRASADGVDDDFRKLDEMCDRLSYPLAVFINIDSTQHHLDRYQGRFGQRLHAFAVTRQEESLRVIHAWRDQGKVRVQEE